MNILLSLGFVLMAGVLASGTCQAQTPPPAPEPASRVDTTPVALPAKTDVRTEFHIKYVGDVIVYLDGGRSAGLTEKRLLEFR